MHLKVGDLVQTLSAEPLPAKEVFWDGSQWLPRRGFEFYETLNGKDILVIVAMNVNVTPFGFDVHICLTAQGRLISMSQHYLKRYKGRP